MTPLTQLFAHLGGKKFVALLLGLGTWIYTHKFGGDAAAVDAIVTQAQQVAKSNDLMSLATMVGSYVAAQGLADWGTGGKTSSVVAMAESKKDA